MSLRKCLVLGAKVKINSNKVLDEISIDLFRNAAIYLEVIDIDISYELMSLAFLLRPNGEFIQKKVSELREMLEVKHEGICKLGNLNMQFGTIHSHSLLKALSKGSYKQNEVKLYINGELIGTDTSVTMPSANTFDVLNFDGGNGANRFYGKTKGVYVFNEALTDDELQQLTGPEYNSFAALAAAYNYTVI